MLTAITPEINNTSAYLTYAEKENPIISSYGNPYDDEDISLYSSLIEAKNDRISQGNYDITQSSLEQWKFLTGLYQFIKKHEDLLNKINIEYSANSQYAKINKNDFFIITNTLLESIAKLNYEKISIEISPLNEIKFKTILNDNTILIITKPFENFKENQLLVFYSVFINKKSVLNDYKNINELVEGINQYIQ
ncbi:MAG: hypothetical protein GXX85_15245 [Ignavibacteria bacterium]|nr:hypothetical protein [Ignavibacteria bacterium]